MQINLKLLEKILETKINIEKLIRKFTIFSSEIEINTKQILNITVLNNRLDLKTLIGILLEINSFLVLIKEITFLHFSTNKKKIFQLLEFLKTNTSKIIIIKKYFKNLNKNDLKQLTLINLMQKKILFKKTKKIKLKMKFILNFFKENKKITKEVVTKYLKILSFNFLLNSIIEIPLFRKDIKNQYDLLEEVTRCLLVTNSTPLKQEIKNYHFNYKTTILKNFFLLNNFKEIITYPFSIKGTFNINNSIFKQQPFLRSTLFDNYHSLKLQLLFLKYENIFEIAKIYSKKEKTITEELHLLFAGNFKKFNLLLTLLNCFKTQLFFELTIIQKKTIKQYKIEIKNKEQQPLIQIFFFNIIINKKLKLKFFFEINNIFLKTFKTISLINFKEFQQQEKILNKNLLIPRNKIFAFFFKVLQHYSFLKITNSIQPKTTKNIKITISYLKKNEKKIISHYE